jgi:Na+-transporting methylmalonyl-CoA/oxaloacetate decarboxylase gamma subunit
MLENVRLTWRPALLVVLLLATAIPVHGQLVGRPIGDDPAYWWTLTDEITPTELREELQSREKSRERLKAAIEAGLHEAVPEEKMADLNYYIDGRLTPALQPMWEAFHLWGDRFDYYPNWQTTSHKQLVDAGLSDAGVEVVMEISGRYWHTETEIREQVTPGTMEFATRVLQPAEAALGRRGLRAQLMNRDGLKRVAGLTGKTEQEIEALHEAWLRDPMAEASLRSLKELKRRLLPDDWAAFRSNLLRVTAPEIQHEGYGEEAFR